MMDESDMTDFRWNILFELASGAEYGLGIKRALESYYGDEVNHGRLYPNLDRLKNAGLIEKSPIDRRTNQYQLTQEGLQFVQERHQHIYSTISTGCIFHHQEGGVVELETRDGIDVVAEEDDD